MSLGSNILIEDLAKMRIENKALRDEVARLRGLLAEIGHDCEHVGSIQHLDKAERRTWTSVASRIKAALTPQAGKGGGEMKLKRTGIWECKIGLCDGNALPSGADSPMRDAVAKAYKELTGQDPKFIFSGWDARLTSGESSAVDGIDVPQ